MTHDKMLLLMCTTVINILTGPTITDLLLPLRELPTREKHLHLDIMMNGGVPNLHIRHTIVIVILIPTTPTLLAATGMNMKRQNQEIQKDGVEIVTVMIHTTWLKTEDGDNGTTVALLHHHTQSQHPGLLLLPMKPEV
jgi:hypothetical protein